MQAITIRPLTTPDEAKACVAIARQAWQSPDINLPTYNLMLAVRHAGGVLTGAVTPTGEIIGYVYSLPAQMTVGGVERFAHWSHQMAVLPGYQQQGIGLRLKQAQREEVLARGLDLILWTFDPMIGRNAHLNLNRLGSICRVYRRNAYGQMSGINAGLPSDRFDTEWWLTDERVTARLAQRVEPLSLSAWRKAGAVIVNPSQGGRPAEHPHQPERAHALLIEIPADFATVKAADMGLAQAWQVTVRKAFERAFAGGFVALSYLTEGDRGFYLLLKEGA